MKKIEIKVQYFLGCPHYKEMLTNVREAITEFGEMIDYSEEIVDTPEMAVSKQFRGSPTLLINGEDCGGMPVPVAFALSCRFYPDGIPSIEKIKTAIQEANAEQNS